VLTKTRSAQPVAPRAAPLRNPNPKGRLDLHRTSHLFAERLTWRGAILPAVSLEEVSLEEGNGRHPLGPLPAVAERADRWRQSDLWWL